TVRCHPARDPDADRADLLRADPGSGQARDPRGRHAVGGAGPDHRLFEVADVAMDVAALRGQRNDRIAHDLAGPGVGHVATPARLEQVEAATAKLVFGEEDVLAPGVPAEREDGLVLEEE